MCDSEIAGGGGPVVPSAVPAQPIPVLSPQPSANGIVEAINPAVQQMASSLSAHSMHHHLQQQQHQQQPLVHPSNATSAGAAPDSGGEYVSAQELEMENHWLREKLKEITSDRDRLLCEVANLRLELDMAELKRLPEHHR
ncbi:uncharacterized protein LOC125957174 [Anopheles darlingi]|uniref:uncharacterized protein LOC125957174 n=1 Tax=Anopheles darlingi TaxID=43151 RepID=UPI002100036B|nr:uncharacterized protein LOC125957174 [Anopheles darlingi]